MLSVLLAVLASVANGAASVLQRKAVGDGRNDRAVGIGTLLDLVRRPAWLGGVGAIIAGFLLQAGALATGPIALVQPVLVLELVATLLLSTVVFHSRLGVREWIAVVGMAGGTALLLSTLDPSGGDARHAPLGRWILGCGITVAVIVALVIAAHRVRWAEKAALLGVATGIAFGFSAALLAGVTAAFADGITGVLTAWQTYLLIVVGPTGFLMLQNALRAGRLVASQPALTLSNPITAIGWGIAVFDEQARGGGWIAGAVAGITITAVCTVLLARSPLLRGSAGASEQDTGARDTESGEPSRQLRP